MIYLQHILMAAGQSVKQLLNGLTVKLTSRFQISSEDGHTWSETMMNDPHLEDVVQKVRELEKELSDADWDNDPRFGVIAKELEHYKKLQAEGKLWEPNF